jgi:membrane associated rhomboid family serine protease
MGIYDRDYYRRDGPSYLGSFLERGTVCKWLIGINVVVFVLQMLTRVQVGDLHRGGYHFQDGFLTDALILNVNDVLHGQVWRLLTYAFLHDTNSIYHILFNMLFLWWFGADMEDLYGPREFLAFYLSAAVAGGVLYTLTEVATGSYHSALGASGAVTGVLVLCAIHYPTRIIYVMFLLPVPIWLFVVFSVGMDAFRLLGHMQNGVAVAGHLGGAVFAFAYHRFHIRLTNLLPGLRDWQRRRNQPRLRVYHEDEDDADKRPQAVAVAAPAASSALDDEQLEAKMDAVLEKISRVGKENLTDSEREVLMRASERLKKRRT